GELSREGIDRLAEAHDAAASRFRDPREAIVIRRESAILGRIGERHREPVREGEALDLRVEVNGIGAALLERKLGADVPARARLLELEAAHLAIPSRRDDATFERRAVDKTPIGGDQLGDDRELPVL